MNQPTQSHDRHAENGILIGNQLDKDQVSNPIARRMVAGFDAALAGLIAAIEPSACQCPRSRLRRRAA